MFLNQIKIALRSLWWNKTTTMINVGGLSIGLAACIIIFLFVQGELSYNKHIADSDLIYRVTVESNNPSGTEYNGHVPYPMAEALRNDYPSLPLISQTHNHGETMFILGDSARFEEDNVMFVDPAFINLFEVEFLQGNPQTSLSAINQIVITESMAKKYFGDENPIGRTINFESFIELQITGIIEDTPERTNLPYDALISYLSFPRLNEEVFGGNDLSSWGWTWSGDTWVKLQDQNQTEWLESQFPEVIKKYGDNDDQLYKSYHLLPFSELHFDERFSSETGGKVTSKETLWSFGLIAILIFLIGCINFVNLSTAQAVKRSREVGIRKVLGSYQAQLIRQFLVESTMVALLSGILALTITEWGLTYVNHLLSVNLSLGLLANPLILVVLLGLVLIIGGIAGFYPAFVLSSFSPVSAFKNESTSYKSSGFNLRRGLVVVQFVITQILIIGTLVVSSQMDYLAKTDLGFRSEAMVGVSLPDNEPGKLEVFRQRLNGISGVEEVSFSSGPPISNNRWTTRYVTEDMGEDITYRVELKFVDKRYVSTYELELLAGELPREAKMDSITGYVVNEALIKQLGISSAIDAIGKEIIPSINGGTKRPITGVVKDFHNYSLHSAIMPCILLDIKDYYYHAGIKLNTSDPRTSLASVEALWSETFPEFIYSKVFLDERIAEVYAWEETVYKGFQLAALLTIFIACLGLYGLISFMAAQRTKEIGIRKILGATTADILQLLSGEFTRLIFVAFVISAPIAWYVMNEWLLRFAYRIEINLIIFLSTLLIAFVLTWITIGLKTFRVANLNPVNTIKND